MIMQQMDRSMKEAGFRTCILLETWRQVVILPIIPEAEPIEIGGIFKLQDTISFLYHYYW
jgi:hypothetical protein